MRRSTSSAFVGRGAERVALADALLERGRRVVIIEGEAGVGKTRLITEVLSGRDVDRRAVLFTRCPPVRVPFMLGPFVDGIARRSPDGVRFGPLAGVLRPLFPEWGDRLPLPPAPAEDGGVERHRLFRALRELLVALGIDAVVVDDVHWADETTFEFLLHLAALEEGEAGDDGAAGPAGPAIAVVVSWRPEDMADRELVARLSRIAAGRSGLRLRLEPLDVEATGELVASILGRRDLSRSLAVHLHERTQGVPLLVEEMLRSLYDRVGASGFEGEWTAARVRALAPPPSLRDSVLVRMGRMSDAARDAVWALAVLAEPADETLIAQVADLDRQTTLRALAEAVDEHLVTVGADRRIAFRHSLVLDAVADEIQPLIRPLLHERAAAALAAMTTPPVARLARHLKEAGDLDGWARHAEKVADLALAGGDDATAKAVFFDLITLTEQTPRALIRLVAKFPLPALARESDYQRLAQVLRRALDGGGDDALPGAAGGDALPGSVGGDVLAGVVGDDALSAAVGGDMLPSAAPHLTAPHLTALDEGQLRWQLARILINADNIAEACAETERAIPLLAELPALAGQAMITLVHLSWPDWPGHVRQRWLRQAVDLLRRSDAELLSIVDLATVLLRFGDEEGWAEAAKLPLHDIAVPHRLLVVRGLANVGHCALVWGRDDEASAYISTAFDLASTYEYPQVRSGLAVMRGHLDYLQGRWNGLADRLRAVCADNAMPAGVRLEADVVRARLALAAGQRTEAEALLRGALDQAADVLGPELIMQASAALAELMVADARVEQALDVTGHAFELLERTGVWIWGADLIPARVRAFLAAGSVDQARAAIRPPDRGLAGKDAPAAHAGLLTARAFLAEAERDDAAAEAFHDQAAAVWDRLRRPHAAALAREGAASCAVRSGRQRGMDALLAVSRTYTRLGATGDRQRVADALRELGVVAPAGGRIGYGEGLSPREREVVELVAAGHTDAEIAGALYKSLNTVRSQIKTAKRKLGVSSRAQLASAVKRGER